MLTQGQLREEDLRLVSLALIADAPRHGYEIIKMIEEMTADWYLPTPNVVYPTLNGFAEAGYLTASADPPKLYTLTDAGGVYVEQNREAIDAVLKRMTGLGERVRRWRKARGHDQPKDADEGNESLVEILARADLQRR